MQHKNDSSYDFYHHKAITLTQSPQDKTNNQPRNQIVRDLFDFSHISCEKQYISYGCVSDIYILAENKNKIKYSRTVYK